MTKKSTFTMQELILIFHILLAVSLIGLVLLQKGKGAGMGAAFGSGASQTVFGSKGSVGFLVKLTIFVAALFFATSITLTYMASKQAKKAQKTNFLGQVEQISKIEHQRIKAYHKKNFSTISSKNHQHQRKS